MKVSELEGAELDCWVAKADGWKAFKEKRGGYELCVIQFPGDREPWARYKDRELWETRYTEIPLTEAVKIGFYGTGVYKFSTDWAVGGPIIEREKITTRPSDNFLGQWHAYPVQFPVNTMFCSGPTPLIAAMRCFVASKYGEEVPHESI